MKAKVIPGKKAMPKEKMPAPKGKPMKKGC